MRARLRLLMCTVCVLAAASGCGFGKRGTVTLYDLGIEAQDRGEYGAAFEYYKEMLMQHPEHLRARFNLAVLYHDQKRYHQAKRHYRLLLTRYPDHARSLVNLADIALAEGDPAQAHMLLLRAVEVEPDRAYPYSYLGWFLQRQQQWTQAQTAYERALAIEDDALTRYRLGMLWLKQKNPAEAQRQFAQAFKRDDAHKGALYQLALLAMEQQQLSEALRYLQRLSHLAPEQADVFILLGKLYLQQGQYATAAVHLWEARHLAPDIPNIERLLLRVYQQMLHQQQEVVNRLPGTPKSPVAHAEPTQ